MDRDFALIILLPCIVAVAAFGAVIGLSAYLDDGSTPNEGSTHCYSQPGRIIPGKVPVYVPGPTTCSAR